MNSIKETSITHQPTQSRRLIRRRWWHRSVPLRCWRPINRPRRKPLAMSAVPPFADSSRTSR